MENGSTARPVPSLSLCLDSDEGYDDSGGVRTNGEYESSSLRGSDERNQRQDDSGEPFSFLRQIHPQNRRDGVVRRCDARSRFSMDDDVGIRSVSNLPVEKSDRNDQLAIIGPIDPRRQPSANALLCEDATEKKDDKKSELLADFEYLDFSESKDQTCSDCESCSSYCSTVSSFHSVSSSETDSWSLSRSPFELEMEPSEECGHSADRSSILFDIQPQRTKPLHRQESLSVSTTPLPLQLYFQGMVDRYLSQNKYDKSGHHIEFTLVSDNPRMLSPRELETVAAYFARNANGVVGSDISAKFNRRRWFQSIKKKSCSQKLNTDFSHRQWNSQNSVIGFADDSKNRWGLSSSARNLNSSKKPATKLITQSGWSTDGPQFMAPLYTASLSNIAGFLQQPVPLQVSSELPLMAPMRRGSVDTGGLTSLNLSTVTPETTANNGPPKENGLVAPSRRASLLASGSNQPNQVQSSPMPPPDFLGPPSRQKGASISQRERPCSLPPSMPLRQTSVEAPEDFFYGSSSESLLNSDQMSPIARTGSPRKGRRFIRTTRAAQNNSPQRTCDSCDESSKSESSLLQAAQVKDGLLVAPSRRSSNSFSPVLQPTGMDSPKRVGDTSVDKSDPRVGRPVMPQRHPSAETMGSSPVSAHSPGSHLTSDGSDEANKYGYLVVGGPNFPSGNDGSNRNFIRRGSHLKLRAERRSSIRHQSNVMSRDEAATLKRAHADPITSDMESGTSNHSMESVETFSKEPASENDTSIERWEESTPASSPIPSPHGRQTLSTPTSQDRRPALSKFYSEPNVVLESAHGSSLFSPTKPYRRVSVDNCSCSLRSLQCAEFDDAGMNCRPASAVFVTRNSCSQRLSMEDAASIAVIELGDLISKYEEIEEEFDASISQTTENLRRSFSYESPLLPSRGKRQSGVNSNDKRISACSLGIEDLIDERRRFDDGDIPFNDLSLDGFRSTKERIAKKFFPHNDSIPIIHSRTDSNTRAKRRRGTKIIPRFSGRRASTRQSSVEEGQREGLRNTPSRGRLMQSISGKKAISAISRATRSIHSFSRIKRTRSSSNATGAGS